MGLSERQAGIVSGHMTKAALYRAAFLPGDALPFDIRDWEIIYCQRAPTANIFVRRLAEGGRLGDYNEDNLQSPNTQRAL